MRYRHSEDRGHGKEAQIGLFHSLTDIFHLLLADEAKTVCTDCIPTPYFDLTFAPSEESGLPLRKLMKTNICA